MVENHSPSKAVASNENESNLRDENRSASQPLGI